MSETNDTGQSIGTHFRRWLLVEGDRLLIAGLIILGTFVLSWVAISLGIVYVGPQSPLRTTFGSGITAGLFTLITVVLTVNQLISSRVFGAPNELQSKFGGVIELQERIEGLTGSTSSPISTAEFLSFLGEALGDRSESLRARLNDDRAIADEDVSSYLGQLDAYSDSIRQITHDTRPIRVIELTAGSQFAQWLHETKQLRQHLSVEDREGVQDDLQAIGELLGLMSVARQYFKTISMQQDLARTSHLLIYSGLPAILIALFTPQLYLPGGQTTVPPAYLPVIISSAIALSLAPLAILLSFLLRMSTIMRYTVSVGPFTPPAEWPWDH